MQQLVTFPTGLLLEDAAWRWVRDLPIPFSFVHEEHAVEQVSQIIELYNDGQFNILLCTTASLDLVPDHSFHRVMVVHDDAGKVEDPWVVEHRYRKFSHNLGPLPAGVNTTTRYTYSTYLICTYSIL